MHNVQCQHSLFYSTYLLLPAVLYKTYTAYFYDTYPLLPAENIYPLFYNMYSLFPAVEHILPICSCRTPIYLLSHNTYPLFPAVEHIPPSHNTYPLFPAVEHISPILQHIPRDVGRIFLWKVLECTTSTYITVRCMCIMQDLRHSNMCENGKVSRTSLSWLALATWWISVPFSEARVPNFMALLQT